MLESEKEQLIRQYAAGRITWHALLEALRETESGQ
jgi:hypothetical protein